jgi:transmembrane sensor
LGTHFNVNAYDDESAVKVSLLEGSVRINKPGLAPTIIKPGEQAEINNTIKVVSNVDMEEVMSWKNGFFKFRKSDIRAVMRQAKRWYDIKVEYPNGVPSDYFSGSLSRNVNLSEFVKILEYSDVRTKINNNAVIINP